MRYRILGPLEVLDDQGQPIPLRGRREQVLVAALALEANRVVSADRLIEALWGEDPPVTAANALQVHVSKLRKKLIDSSGSEGPLQTKPPGYVLQVRPGELDAEHFVHLATGSGSDEQPLAVSARLADALALWRGPVLDGLELDPSGRAGVARLQELRASAVEGRVQADLALGRHAQLVGELEELVRTHPLREGLRAKLMIALYRSGRQADALAVYRQTREILAEELGIDPSPGLQALELAILNHSPELNAPMRGDTATVKATLPSGTVTLLFSDIEGSTRLWEQAPDAMAEALKRHDEMLRGAIQGSGGYVFKTVGDAFCAAFPTATEAVQAAETAQRAMVAEPWPAGTVLRVRLALHTGECEERDGDYFGPAVNRTARLEATAHGGQVVLSRATADIVGDRLPQGVGLRHLGTHHLKDLGRPEEVFQLEMEGLETEFPPLRSLDNPKLVHNLPELVSSFVGRESEVIEVRKLIEASRLVTLTGAGGSGKTRLALQVAADVLNDFADGVWMVELASLADPELVASATASALGVREVPGRPLLETLVDAVADRHLLVVLDNCEHLLDAAAMLAETLVRSCPRLSLLATSREPLAIDGERAYRVPSLSLPGPEQILTPDEVRGFDAVQLFVERAVGHQPDFLLDESNAATVASLCRKLDGMPLALELAAARLGSLSVADIEQRLDDRFRILTRGRRTALPRQQTLRALIDWSYDALTSGEQDVLRRLSVFAGGWDLDACQIVCSLGSPAETDVIDVLGSLVSKSLVQAESIIGGLRYGLLETIRQYGAEKLAEAGSDEQQSTRNAHADVFMGFVELAATQLRGPDQIRWIDRLDQEYENIRTALSCLSDQDRVSNVLRMSVALKEYWIRRGYFNEGLQILDDALVRPDIEDLHLRAAALIAAGRLGNEMRRGQRSQAMLIEGLGLSRQVDDGSLTSAALIQLAYAASDQGDYPSAMQLVGEAIESASRANDPVLLGDAHLTRSNIPWRSDRSAARQDCLDAIFQFSKVSDPCGLAAAELSLAMLDLREGNLEAAYARFRNVLDKSRESKDDRQILTLHTYFGLIEMLNGDTSVAKRSFKEGLTLAVRMGHRPVLFNNLIGLAGCASAVAENERAAALYGAASTLQNQLDMILDPDLAGLCESDKKRLQRRMGGSEFAASFEMGSGLTTSDAIRIARE